MSSDVTVIYCANCGSQLEAEASACDACGHDVINDNGDPSGVDQTTVSFTAGEQRRPVAVTRPRIPDTSIVLGDGERVWKKYAVTYLPGYELLGIRISRPSGNGTLYVTNSRVLFHASHRRRGRRSSRLIQETRIEQITGVSAFVTRSSGWLAPLIVLLCGLGFIDAIIRGSLGGAIVLLLIGAAAYGVAQRLGKRGTVGVLIHSSASELSPLSFGQFGGSGGRLFQSLLAPLARLLPMSSAQDARDLQVAPAGPQAEQVVDELGALIADLQSKGDLAGTHWGVEA
jgi:hypothetical protein